MIGTKPTAEAADAPLLRCVVEERCILGRSVRVTERGLYTSDYADMSNEKSGENPGRRNPKISWGRFVRPGLVGP